VHAPSFTARAVSTFRRSRSRLTRSAMDMEVLINGWLDFLTDKRRCLHFLWALRRVWADTVKFYSFHEIFFICHNKYFTKFTFCGLHRQIPTRYLVWHQNQRASAFESRDILRGKFHQRPNLPPDAAGPHPRLTHARCQLKVLHAS